MITLIVSLPHERYVLRVNSANVFAISVGYLFVDAFVDWNEAIEHCLNLNGTLMEPRTQEQFDIAVDLKRHSYDGSLWMGGTDEVEEGVWRWRSDGALVDMSRFWRDGFPAQGHILADYLCLRWYNTFEDCTTDLHVEFICEIP